MHAFTPISRPRSRRWLTLALTTALAGGTAACAEDEEAPVVEETATIPAEVPAAPVATAEPAEGEVFPPPDLGPGEVAIRLTEWDLEISEDTVPAGPTTFVVRNAGSVEHAFEVEGQGIEKETEHLQPGATATLTADLTPGRYTLYCPVEMQVNHRTEGMVTTLHVRE